MTISFRTARSLASCFPVAMWVIDRSGKVRWDASDAFLTLPSWKRLPAGKTLDSWNVPGNVVAAVTNAHESALAGKRTPLFFPIDGHEVHGWAGTQLGRFGRRTGSAFIAWSTPVWRDEPSSHNFEESTRFDAVTPPKLDRVLREVVDCVLLLDAEGTVVHAHHSDRQTSWAVEQGQAVSTALEEGAARRLTDVLKRVADRGVTELLELQARSRSGETHWYDVRLSRLLDQFHAPRIVLSAQDISQRKRGEAERERQDSVLRRLVEIQDRERRMVAYDIHDGLVQLVFSARSMLEASLDSVTAASATETLESALQQLEHAMSEGRRMISELRPMIVDEVGLREALEFLRHEFSQNSHATIEVRPRLHLDRLEPLLEGALFRIVQQAVQNAIVHGEAEEIVVRLTQVADKHIVVEIWDDGRGFDVKQIPRGRYGIEGIRERARAFGGGCTIESTLGKGSRLTVKIPLSANDSSAP